jgi:hypothetical protein
MVGAMLNSESAWEDIASFCENVMSQEETAETKWEEYALAASLRRRRMRRMRR